MILVPDERNSRLREIDQADARAESRKVEAERAKAVAAEAVALAAIQVVRVLVESLQDDDPQVRLRAADILLSRSIPKVAAKHAGLGEDDAIDTVDVSALRESILEQIKKGR